MVAMHQLVLDCLKAMDQINRMEQVRKDLLSENIRSVAGGEEFTDVTLVCKDGLQVQAHASLLAALSKKMGELFATCITTFPAMVVFIPDMEKEVVEKLLSLYSNKWEVVEVDHSLRQAAELLGLPLPVMARKHQEANVSCQPQTKKQLSDSKAAKPTMPSMLVRVKREVIEKNDGDLPHESDSENSDFESEEEVESALEDDKISEPSLDCGQCGTTFEEKDELRIHIGEVHMEEQLLTELFLTFPGGALSLTCVGCGEECSSDYEKREHILLSHPWPSLRAEVDETLAKISEDTKGIENTENPVIEDNLKMDVSDHIESIQENENQVGENEIECDVCGTTFENRDEARIHIGEVHLEDELQCELFKVFPGEVLKCKECGAECGSEYEKKEHILLQHPWPMLKALADEKESQHVEKDYGERHIEENIDDGAELDMEKEEIVEEKLLAETSEKENLKNGEEKDWKNGKWYNGFNFSCNFCENRFSERSSSNRHLFKVHDIKRDQIEHVSDQGKKYSCKICRFKLDHNLSSIRNHIRRHKLNITEYEKKYETINQETNHPDDSLDLLGEILDETLNELCAPEETSAKFPKESRKRKSSGDLQQNSKHLKPSTSENKELESQIEFSDSSDEED